MSRDSIKSTTVVTNPWGEIFTIEIVLNQNGAKYDTMHKFVLNAEENRQLFDFINKLLNDKSRRETPSMGFGSANSFEDVNTAIQPAGGFGTPKQTMSSCTYGKDDLQCRAPIEGGEHYCSRHKQSIILQYKAKKDKKNKKISAKFASGGFAQKEARTFGDGQGWSYSGFGAN